jgi:hypothetical protein
MAFGTGSAIARQAVGGVMGIYINKLMHIHIYIHIYIYILIYMYVYI